MKHFVGIVGNNWSGSRNRQLLQLMKRRYADQFDLTLLETGDLPLFSQDIETTPSPVVTAFRDQIAQADGIIIATAEHNHSIPTSLKNALDWCSRVVHPIDQQTVMLVGASLGPMGTVRAQMHLRQILDSPGIGARVLPSNEVLISFSGKQFTPEGDITNPATLAQLDLSTQAFMAFVG